MRTDEARQGANVPKRRIGAYVLPGDTTWLSRSLPAYYAILDDLVVPVPKDGRGWRGQRVPIAQIRKIIAGIDTRGIAREITGAWTNRDRPMAMDTAQRQAAVDALRERVDWILQIDNDEYLPDISALLHAIEVAEERGSSAVEWPMRVLYRTTARYTWEVVAEGGEPRYDYPGPIAVRADVTLVDARRPEAPFIRAVVVGDSRSLQLKRAPAPAEHRWEGINDAQAIVHNSWARSRAQTWRKVRSWGHADGARGVAYFLLRWYPAPITWRFMRDFHPFARGLWPRLSRRRRSPDEG
jgi:hypothetical protein